ncbi:MAG: helix-turn-helix domain-containing protein [Candidatus Saccharicenans sp.]
MESLGQQLKQEREKKGLSLKEISLQTKIGLRYLEAIENDQLELLPGGFFTRQILKTYLTFIGQEPTPWLAKYQEAGLLLVEPPASRISKPKKTPGIKVNNIAWIILTVVVMSLFIGLIYLSIKSSRQAVKSPAASKTAVVIPVTPIEPRAETKEKTKKTEAEVQPYQGLDLELTFNEDCWIQVYADGNLVIDGLKLEGYKTSVKAKSELRINLGNAGGVSFILNGRPGKPFGKRGEVIKNIKITIDNLSQFVVAEKPS